MTNAASVGCSMNGYPEVAPYQSQPGGGGSSSVQALVQPIPAQTGPIGAAPSPVTLPPGGSAVFFLTWSTGGASCQLADGISLDTPTSSTIALVIFSFRFCGGALKQSVVLPAGTAA